MQKQGQTRPCFFKYGMTCQIFIVLVEIKTYLQLNVNFVQCNKYLEQYEKNIG